MKSEDFCTSQNRLYALTICLLALFVWFQISLHVWVTGRLSHFPSPQKHLPTSLESHHSLTYLLHDPRICRFDHPPPSLIIFVASAPGHRARRDAIRRTWASRPSHVLFLLGRASTDAVQGSLQAEHAQFGDLIQTDFVDTYRNLTLKTLSALQWTVDYCARAQFLMKTDDDVFVNIPLLLKDLELRKNESYFSGIRGCLKGHVAPPLRPRISDTDGMVLVPELGMSGGHPPFAAGAGYVISGDLVGPLLSVAREIPLFPIEDVFITAKCARRLGVVAQHDGRFSCGERLAGDCEMSRRFTGHWVSPQRQLDIWNKLTTGTCR